MKFKKLTSAVCLSLLAASANSAIIAFDDKSSIGVASGTGTGMNGTEPYGEVLTFTDFTVTAGQSTNTNLGSATSFSFSSDIVSRRVYQDWGNAGLGAVKFDSLAGDGMESNIGGSPKKDEVLFFDFGMESLLETVFFNGGHTDLTKSDGDTDYKDGKDALFNIFVSSDGENYTGILGGQKQPTDRDYLSTGLIDAYQYYAVSSTGWGAHSSYVEAIEFTKVTEPGTLALLGLGLAGIGIARRKIKA